MRILNSSGDLATAPACSYAYRQKGYGVAAGVANLDPIVGEFDVIHLQWPEELLAWSPGDEARAARMLEQIDWWSSRAVLVATVHNLIPHSTDRLDGPEAAFFRALYERVDVLTHYSEFSRARYRDVYPSLDAGKQIVTPIIDYNHMLRFSEGREAARKALAIGENERVFALCGALRRTEELALVQAGWSSFADRDARLLFASKPSFAGIGRISKILEKMKHERWLRDPRITNFGGHVDDALLVRIIEAADAILIPRLGHHLNSGVVSLAFTLGTAVVAPETGANSENVPLPHNELYEVGNAQAFAAAMQRQAMKDSMEVRRTNLAYREEIGWSRIIDLAWPLVMAAGKAKGIAAFR